MTESCPFKMVLSGGAGFAMGGFFGLFMSSVRILWIDSFCINQADVEETKHSIPFDNIYMPTQSTHHTPPPIPPPSITNKAPPPDALRHPPPHPPSRFLTSRRARQYTIHIPPDKDTNKTRPTRHGPQHILLSQKLRPHRRHLLHERMHNRRSARAKRLDEWTSSRRDYRRYNK